MSVTNETEKELIDFLNEARFLFLLLFQISHKKSFNVVISTVFSGILFRIRWYAIYYKTPDVLLDSHFQFLIMKLQKDKLKVLI